MAARARSSTSSSDADARADAVCRWLARRGSARNREGMTRYGITSARMYGVSMAAMRPLVRRLGRDQALAAALWRTGWLEARLIAGCIADPAACTPRSMDRWARDFDSWALTDGTCLHLFCDSPHAWGRVAAWRRRRGEQQKRAAFALLACLAVHDRVSNDARFARALDWVVEAATDERPFVRKAVNWALRQVGKRSLRLRDVALDAARRIAALDTPGSRWIASDARRELMSAAVVARLRARA
ncbi:MAG: DNA alkylation repair protein [Vicinamibacterales bacterium]